MKYSDHLIGQGIHKATYLGKKFQLAREHGSKTPSGRLLKGEWVLRDNSGNYIDFDKYRHDIADRYKLLLIGEA